MPEAGEMGERQTRAALEKRIAEFEQLSCDDPEQFTEIYQSVNEFIFEHDLEGNFTGICPRFIGFLGYSREEMLCLNVQDLLLEKDRAHFQGYLDRVVENGRDEGLIPLINKAGRRRIVEHKNLLAVRPDGTRTIRGIAKDVTDVLETEQALIESEIRFRTILDSIEDGYFEVDLTGSFTFFNDVIPVHIGYQPDELMGLNYQRIMDEANARRVFETFHSVFVTGTPTKSFDWELMKKDGTRIFVEASVSLLRDRNSEPTGFCGIIRDISDRKRSEQELAYLAYHDALTGLHNRKAFLERLDEAVREARRHENYRSVLFIDLDHFKKVNDVYGHEIGDRLLVQVASRLRRVLRDTDYVSRLGGDEFTIIIGGTSRPSPEKLAERIIKTLGRPYDIQGTKIDFVTPSIGISTYPDDGHDAETLLKRADQAMYRAKERRNTFSTSRQDQTGPHPSKIRKLR
jgi:diguanylate cyclase (GGDEF)-like protein/PAS domain S-box-containing protein